MSAFIQEPEHLCYMVQAGIELARGPDYPLRWWAADPSAEAWTERGSALPSWEALQRVEHLRRELTPDTADQVVLMLHDENVRSVNHRYDEEDLTAPPTYRRTRLESDPVWLLKAINGYEYQACEHPEWDGSEAQRFCEALTGLAVRRLPGYDAAPTWSISEDSIDRFFAEARERIEARKRQIAEEGRLL